jgi:DNA-binding XRE family transcriptional regulator
MKMSRVQRPAIDLPGEQCFSLFMKKRKFAAIGHRITAAREALEISQAEICRNLKIAPNTWNQYEKGVNKIPPETALALEKRYHITVEWIYIADSL